VHKGGLRPNLSILAPGYLCTPPKARDELAENSRNFAFYESASLRKLYKAVSRSAPFVDQGWMIEFTACDGRGRFVGITAPEGEVGRGIPKTAGCLQAGYGS
jgi:hypothetical protein